MLPFLKKVGKIIFDINMTPKSGIFTKGSNLIPIPEQTGLETTSKMKVFTKKIKMVALVVVTASLVEVGEKQNFSVKLLFNDSCISSKFILIV